MRAPIASIGVLVALVVAAPAAAATGPALPSSDPFYTYSGSLAGVAPGTVLRSRTITLAGFPTTTPVSATQLLYRTSGELGQPTVTVTTVIRPLISTGVTKLVSYQTAYDALGSECDPSYTLQGGNPGDTTARLEADVMSLYVAAGDTVVTADYEGEALEWAAGQESGYDTLDGIRAAENYLALPRARTPVAIVGYSGGSIATEFASELAPSYAPGLDLVGAAEGGLPVDFAHNLIYIDGSQGWSGVIPAVLVSLGRAFDLDIDSYLSPYGLQLTQQVQDQCVNGFADTWPGLTYQQLLKPQYQNLLAIPIIARIINRLIMSRTGTPTIPLYLGNGNADGTGDGVMIAGDVEGLAHTYCERGLSVQFHQYTGLTHEVAAIPFEIGAFGFVTARLDGVPAINRCATIGTGNSLAPLPVPPILLDPWTAPGSRTAAGPDGFSPQ